MAAVTAMGPRVGDLAGAVERRTACVATLNFATTMRPATPSAGTRLMRRSISAPTIADC